MVTLTPYRGADEAALLATWNAALPVDPIDARTFRRKVLLDPNFDPSGLIVARDAGEVVGFCLCLVRRVPLEKVGMEPERGWITAFGVHPRARRQGIGSALMEGALAWFRQTERREVAIAPYTPNYFVPGVDVEAYADGLRWLTERFGFEVVARPLSMDANIVRFDPAPYAEREAALRAAGVRCEPLAPTAIPEFIAFMQAHLPGDWVRHARELLLDAARGHAGYDQILVAWLGEEVVGYCQFDGEHFGPYGVRSDLQGKGIGTVLMVRCLQAMRERGLHHAWVLWTSDETAQRIYARFGFRETRRFAVLRKRW